MAFVKRILPVIIWALIIWFLSSQPIIGGASVSVPDYIFKKSAHITEYAILVFLISRAFTGHGRVHQAVYLSLIYAFVDEMHQLFTPGRTGTIKDVLVFDLFGMMVAFVLLSYTRLKHLLH
jgi:VanZ family protein